MKIKIQLMFSLFIGLGVITALFLTCDLQEKAFFAAGHPVSETQSVARK